MAYLFTPADGETVQAQAPSVNADLLQPGAIELLTVFCRLESEDQKALINMARKLARDHVKNGGGAGVRIAKGK